MVRQAAPIQEVAFPKLTDAEIAPIRPLAATCDYEDGETVFHAGQAELDLFIVESGQIEIRNPTDADRLIVAHEPGEFAGDIDLLTGRPVIVNAVARGKTRVLRVPNGQIRSLLNRVPSLGEKLIVALARRRELLMQSGVLGLRVVGPARCRATNTVREFLYKNFVPFTWFDPESDEGHAVLAAAGNGEVEEDGEVKGDSPIFAGAKIGTVPAGAKTGTVPAGTEIGTVHKSAGTVHMPAIQCSDGRVLCNPSLRALAMEAGVWRHCPTQESDFAIVGAGPAGIAAAVYAASEGLSTLMLDRLGPGGQAGGSSRIENFIGFPAGLSGADLATRGVLQMLKFGARIVAPVEVQRLTPARSSGDPHVLQLDCGAEIRCRVLLLALGVRWRRLEATGADRFNGGGVYYACTTVEADIYDKADVAVVGGGNSAGQAVMFLAECCRNRTVHLLIRRTLGPGMSEYLASRVRTAANVVVHEQTEIDAVCGNGRIDELVLRNSATAQQSRLPCAAVFVFIGAEPAAEWLPAELARDSKGYLLTGSDAAGSRQWPLTDREPCPLETTIPRVLAAGDIRSGSTKRVGFAVGDGSLAVTCAHSLLSAGR